MRYESHIQYKKTTATFDTDDCGYGREWGTTRAIAGFFNRNPHLAPYDEKDTYKTRAAKALADGLVIELRPILLLATKDGYRQATDAVPVKFTNPAWLAQYDFFVARTLGDPPLYAPGDHFRLTEASTGYGVNESLGDTRTQAAKLGKATLAFVGPDIFAVAIARAPKISREKK